MITATSTREADAAECSAVLDKCLARFPGFLAQLRTADWPREIKERDAREWLGHLARLRFLVSVENVLPNPRRRRQLGEIRRIQKEILRWL